MSLNISSILEYAFKERGLPFDKQINFISFFKRFKLNSWIYPGVIKRKVNIPISDVYFLLNELEKYGILKSYFEVVCHECNKVEGEIYESIDDIPEFVVCENCDREIIAIKNAFMIFKVIKYELE